MDMENMKDLWQEQERSIKEMSDENDRLLRRIIKDRAHSSLEKIKNIEYLSAGLCLFFIILALLMAGQVGRAPVMVISYIIVLSTLTLGTAWYIYKIVYLSKIDLSAGAVTDTAKKIQRFRLFIIRERLASFISVLFWLPFYYLLVFQWVHHKSALDYLPFAIISIIIALVFGIGGSVIIYRRYYLNHLQTILTNLEEIKAFEKES